MQSSILLYGYRVILRQRDASILMMPLRPSKHLIIVCQGGIHVHIRERGQVTPQCSFKPYLVRACQRVNAHVTAFLRQIVDTQQRSRGSADCSSLISLRVVASRRRLPISHDRLGQLMACTAGSPICVCARRRVPAVTNHNICQPRPKIRNRCSQFRAGTSLLTAIIVSIECGAKCRRE